MTLLISGLLQSEEQGDEKTKTNKTNKQTKNLRNAHTLNSCSSKCKMTSRVKIPHYFCKALCALVQLRAWILSLVKLQIYKKVKVQKKQEQIKIKNYTIWNKKQKINTDGKNLVHYKKKTKKLTNIHTAWGSAVSHFQVLMFHQIINTIWPIEAEEKYKKERKKLSQRRTKKTNQQVSFIGHKSQFMKRKTKTGGFTRHQCSNSRDEQVVQHFLHPQTSCGPSPTFM